MKFCVYTRSFYESPYINFFIEHYLKLGFDKIFILKTDEIEIRIDDKFLKFIEIANVKNEGNKILTLNIGMINKNEYEWFLNVDIDEFLFIDSKYSNIKEYVNYILKKKPNTNMIFFRWLNINKLSNENIFFENLIKNYKISKNPFIKSISRTNLNIKNVNPHLCWLKDNNYQIFFENLDTLKPLTEIIN